MWRIVDSVPATYRLMGHFSPLARLPPQRPCFAVPSPNSQQLQTPDLHNELRQTDYSCTTVSDY